MIPESVERYVEGAGELFGDNLLSIVMVGSFARGDETSASDVDLFVLVHSVDSDLLRKSGELVRGIPARNELNPAFVSLSELRAHPDWFELHKVLHDGVVLLGRLPDDISSTESELTVAKRIAREVLMSSRHYLAVGEPAENFTGGKLWAWNLKPLSFALRYYHFHKTGNYIRKLTDLTREYPILDLDPVADYQRIVDDCVTLCEEIMGA